MVYITETLQVCHELTEYGKEKYNQLLQKEADCILFNDKYPIFSFFMKIYESLGLKLNVIDKIFEKLMRKIKIGNT